VKGSGRGLICGRVLELPGRTEVWHENYVKTAASGPRMGLGTSSLRLRSATNNYKKGELIWITAGNVKRENEHQIRAALNTERCADMK
jgi:hypothetical protein